MAHTIIKLNQGGADDIGHYNKKNLKFTDLMSYYSDIKADMTQYLHFISLYGTLFQFLDKTSEWYKDAKLYGNKLLPGYLLYYGEIHPATGALYYVMGMTELLLGKPKEAL